MKTKTDLRRFHYVLASILSKYIFVSWFQDAPADEIVPAVSNKYVQDRGEAITLSGCSAFTGRSPHPPPPRGFSMTVCVRN